jgi:hypothetical protein
VSPKYTKLFSRGGFLHGFMYVNAGLQKVKVGLEEFFCKESVIYRVKNLI